jgi:hypothetical protein
MVNLRLFMISSWITVNFGKNPVNGGKPPNDSSVVNSKNLIAAPLFTVIACFTN